MDYIKLIWSYKSASLKWVMRRRKIVYVWTVCAFSQALTTVLDTTKFIFWFTKPGVLELQLCWCWDSSLSSPSLRASWNLSSTLPLSTVYGTLTLKAGICTSEILTWITRNVFPFSAMPTKPGQNQYTQIQAIYWLKSSFCLGKIPLNWKISACIFAISQIIVSYAQ